jgi:raffinose/stachyose/melibiose transport system substrate-binding protein
MIQDLSIRIKTAFPLLFVAGVLVGSSVYIIQHRRANSPPGTITLRIGHWQLETSVREAFEEMAAEYRKSHPNVRIAQDAIPDGMYGQWVSTQLMGGTAPDIVQVGKGLTPSLWISYYNRYFIPLTPYVDRPNPYNRGTSLADTPLRNTHKDGMRNAYVEEIQEYVNIPLSLFGTRVFYNRDLLRRLTGLEAAPTEYRAFLDVCRRIGEQTDDRGRPFLAIAGSRPHFGLWEGWMTEPLTYGGLRKVDFNRDGFAGADEVFVAFKSGLVDLHYPPFAAKFRMIEQLIRHFQSGYTGLTRDEAVFLFAQQRAVFMTTGTWDARSLQEQARGRFEVGVMDYPWPAPTDPEFGALIEGPPYQRARDGFPFAVTRTCQHPEVAIDFLLFLAGQRQNERLNRRIGWIPSIVGAEMDPFLKAFEPHLEGMYPALNLNLGGETWIKWQQLFSLFQVRQISFDDMAREFEAFYKERGLLDFLELQKDWRRGMQVNEQFLAGIRARALTNADPLSSEWVKYRALTAARQVFPEITHARQIRLVERGPGTGAVGPCEYSPDVIARVTARLRATSK